MPGRQVDNTFPDTPGKYVPVGLDERRPWRSTVRKSVLNLSPLNLELTQVLSPPPVESP